MQRRLTCGSRNCFGLLPALTTALTLCCTGWGAMVGGMIYLFISKLHIFILQENTNTSMRTESTSYSVQSNLIRVNTQKMKFNMLYYHSYENKHFLHIQCLYGQEPKLMDQYLYNYVEAYFLRLYLEMIFDISC